MSGVEIAIIGAVVTALTLISTVILHVRIRSGCCSMEPIDKELKNPSSDSDSVD